MTAAEMTQLLGQTLLHPDGKGLWFDVTVVDVRTRYGIVDVKVQPVKGQGARWVAYADA